MDYKYNGKFPLLAYATLAPGNSSTKLRESHATLILFWHNL